MNLRKRIHEIESRAGIAIAAVTRTRGGHLRLMLPCGPAAIRRAQQQGTKHHAQ